MSARVQSAVLTTAAVAGIGALVVAPVAAPPQVSARPVVSTEIRLTATPSLGALPIAFLQNQLEYCSVICPFAVQGAVTIPLGAVQTPAALLNALATTGSLTRALGAAAASVTGPANTAAEGIILNDVDRVVPKAFNNLEISVVQLLRVGSAVLNPADLPQAVEQARETILAGLNQPLPGPGVPVPTETGAETLPEVVAVEAVKVSAAVAFQAGELLLLGVVQTADAGAQELARTGDPLAAVSAAAARATGVIDVASNIVTGSVDTAAANIGAALKDPFPKAVSTREVGSLTPTAERRRDSADESVTPAKTRPLKPVKPKTEDRPVRKVVRDVGRAVGKATGALTHSPKKSLRHNNSKSSAGKGQHRARHQK
ncbi:hypothetical protein ACWDTP_14160 [Mycobacterium sp. NPDC003449]